MRGSFLFLIAALVIALGAGPALAAKGGKPEKGGKHHQRGKHGGGAVYTQTQSPAGNEIVVYKRRADGSITERDRVATGGVGAAMTPPFGFPIVDSQGSVELTKNGRLLFAVNAGDDTISSFRVRRHGGLTLVDREASGGDLPVSLDSQGRLLYVVNSLSGNISGFRFTRSGEMSSLAGSSEPLSTSGPGGVAAQIGFAPRPYRVLTVTLRGTQVIDTFKLGKDGTPGPARANAATDMNPFGFEYRRDGTAIVSNAGEAGDPADTTKFLGRASSYDLARSGALTPIDSISVDGQRATCWVVITNNQRYTFMTNTLSQSVSRFRIQKDGELTLLGHVATGPGFASDEALSRDSRYLYVLLPSIMGGTSHIDFYRVGHGGSLTQIGATPSNLPPGVSGLAAR
jgi:6-phosphogluconolactonase